MDPIARYNPSPITPSSGSGGGGLLDVLDRVLDKGIVIAGDVRINLLDIELLTIKLRLLVASVDKAKEMGIDWWEHDPSLTSRARSEPQASVGSGDPPRSLEAPSGQRSLAEENERLRAEVAELRRADERRGS